MVNKHHYSLARLRRGLAHFGIGKIVNGALGFAILLLIARSLPAEDYGAYLILISAGQLLSAVALMGLNAVSISYVPRFRIGSGGPLLFRFIGSLVAARALLLLLSTTTMLLLAKPITAFFGVPGQVENVRLLAISMIAGGLATYFRIGVFEPLLQQGYAQAVWFARNVAFAGLLVFSLHLLTENPTVADVLIAEIGATVASLSVALVCLLAYWRKERRSYRTADDWEPPRLGAMIRTGLHDHVSFLMRLTGNQQAILLVSGRLLGPEATAAFGFVLTLVQQIKQYLPAEVLAPVIRPKLVAQFAIDQDFRLLNQRSTMLYKASLFVLGPVLAIFAIAGPEVLNFLSAGRYGDGATVMLVLLFMLIPASHNVILWGIMITVGRMDIFARGAVSSLLTVPLAIVLVGVFDNSISIAAAMLLATILYNLIVVRGLRAKGFEYKMDFRGLSMICVSAAVAAAVLLLVPQGTAGLFYATAATAVACVGFLTAAFVVKPFSAAERQLINKMARRNVFIW